MSVAMSSVTSPTPSLLRQYLVLTKPRVTQLAVFCAVIGMFLATPRMPDLQKVVVGTIGIWLLAAAAFAINCLIEQQVDARMLRTARRGTARGTISDLQVMSLSGLLGGVGMFLLYQFVNPLSMWLTFATFVGYAIIYTIILKPRTPQNIVIGGGAGAFPPMIGWIAVTGQITLMPVVLFLIIFFWTPPHFWALALFVQTDYAKAGIPMLPVVAGEVVTRRQIALYSVVLAPLSLVPWWIGGAGALYGWSAAGLGALFLALALRVWLRQSQPDDAMKPEKQLFAYSVLYLFALFALLLTDHLVRGF